MTGIRKAILRLSIVTHVSRKHTLTQIHAHTHTHTITLTHTLIRIHIHTHTYTRFTNQRDTKCEWKGKWVLLSGLYGNIAQFFLPKKRELAQREQKRFHVKWWKKSGSLRWFKISLDFFSRWEHILAVFVSYQLFIPCKNLWKCYEYERQTIKPYCSQTWANDYLTITTTILRS